MSKKKKHNTEVSGEKVISFVNWFFTLIFSVLPGINLVFFILTIGFARTKSKRRFATAALVLSLMLLISLGLMLYFYSPEIIKWCEKVLAEEPANEAATTTAKALMQTPILF